MASRPPATKATPQDTTDEFAVGGEGTAAPAATTRAVARETDPRRLEQRQKQIDFGKNTRGYQRYSAAVPRDKRRFLHGGLVPIDPMTPDIYQACSKRAFDGQVRKWRRMLHEWDPEGEAEQQQQGEGEGGEAATTAPATKNAAATPGNNSDKQLVSPGTKRNASNTSRTPASAVHPRKQRSRGGAGGKGGAAEVDGDGGKAAGGGSGGIFADAVLVAADEAAAP